MKTSAYGRESGFQVVLDYTRPKTVWMNTSSDPLTSQFHSRQGEKMIRDSAACRIEKFSVIDLQKMPNYPLGAVQRVES